MIDKVKFAKYRVDNDGRYIDPEMRKIQFKEYAQKYRVDDNGHYIDPEMRKIQLENNNIKKSVLGRPKDEVEAMWTEWGANPKQKLSFYDKIEKHDPKEINYVRHENPTLSERAKEYGQGLAGFAGGTVDFGNDIANLVSSKPVETDYRTEWKNHKSLRTKNNDETSYALRGAGEFIPEILPAAGIGKIIGKGITYGAKAAKPLIKKWAGKTANFIQTPITKTNIAGFAGAGAAHGALHTPDYTGKEVDVPWYVEMPTVIGGGIAGSGLYGGGKAIGKSIMTSNKGLPITKKMFASYIDKGKEGGLDNIFIPHAKKAGVDLNAFNIYKNNERPYNLAKRWNNEEYSKILPMMNDKSISATDKILNNVLGRYHKELRADTTSENISKILNNNYKNRKSKTKQNFEDAVSKIDDNDIINYNKTFSEAQKIYDDTSHIPASKGTSYHELSKISKDILDKKRKYLNKLEYETGLISEYGNEPMIGLKDILSMRAAVNEHGKKIPVSPGYLGKNRTRILGLIKTIDDDLRIASKKGDIHNPNFLGNYEDALKYHGEHLGPYKNSELFNTIADSSLKGEKLNVNDTIGKSLKKKSTLNDLESLIENIKKDDTYLHSEGKKELNQLKRITLQKEVFGKKNPNLKHLQYYIDHHKHDPIFTSKFDNNANAIPSMLNKDISPLLKKHKNLEELFLKHKLGHSNAPVVDITSVKPSLWGALGASAFDFSPKSLAIGAGVGAGASLVSKALHKTISKRLHKNLTDKDFIDELIRLGKIKKEDKKGVLNFLANKTADNEMLKTQIIRSLDRKNEGEKWGE